MAIQEKRLKTESINVRVKPEIKRLAEELAERENRTLSNWVESLILREAEKAGIRPKRAP
jgi:uncharacterized protein (DUF1778 family)